MTVPEILFNNLINIESENSSVQVMYMQEYINGPQTS